MHLVLTSGEQMVKPLLALDSTGLIAATVAVKMVVYGLSVAAGFRGGPYFPVIFAGAGRARSPQPSSVLVRRLP